MSSPKIRVLVVLPAIIPSTKIGIINPLKGLEKQNLVTSRVLLETQVNRFWSTSSRLRDLLSKYDVLVMCRNQSSIGLKLALEARRQWVPLIYDIDDNFFDIGLTSAIGRLHRHPAQLYQLEQIISMSSLTRVYSRPMSDHMKRLAVEHDIVDSYFDMRLIKRTRPEKHRKVIRIAYPTSRVHDELAEIFVDSMHELLKKYGKKIELHLWSNVPGPLRGFKNVIRHKPINDYEKFIRSFHSYGFDIGLAPLRNTIFHRSKTNNKYREYSGCGVAGVYSNVDVYTDCVSHENNGMIAENTQESWTSAIETLIQDDALRKSITAAGAETVKGRYSFEQNLKTWHQQLKRVTTQPYIFRTSKKPASRPLSIVALSASDQEEKQKGLNVRLSQPGVTTSLPNSEFDQNQNKSLYLGRRERRVKDYKTVSGSLGATFSRIEFTVEGLANLKVAGILVVIAANSTMAEASLEFRNNALAMIVDTTTVVETAELDELATKLPNWAEASPKTIFVVSESLRTQLGDLENVVFVENEWVENEEAYFSSDARIYKYATVLDDVARKLSAPPDSDRNRIQVALDNFGKRTINRWRSLKLLMREMMSD